MGFTAWFEAEFNVQEPRPYAACRSAFGLASAGDGGPKFRGATGELEPVVLICPDGTKRHVGPFETPRLAEMRAAVTSEGEPVGLGGLRYGNVAGDARSLILDPANAGAVFQVASQLNCLEMVGPNVRPEDGVTIYGSDRTQGPACAMAAPAGTVYRNFLCQGGHGQSGGSHRQIDTASGAADCLDNAKNKYWSVSNGYLLPTAPGKMRALGDRLSADNELSERVRDSLGVGIHWDTQTARRRRDDADHVPHRVCQVFCSAMPLAYAKSTPVGDWAAFARLVLEAAYENVLCAGALLAARRNERQQVFLTAIGGGVFGNPTSWVADAILRALRRYALHPLDVTLVSYKHIPGPETELGSIVAKLASPGRRGQRG